MPNIPQNARWISNASTVTGGVGLGPTLRRLHSPTGIWVEGNNIVVIADSLNHRIIECNQKTKKKKQIAGHHISGRGANQLCRPTDLIFDKISKTFIICDSQNRRVLRWSPGSTTYKEIVVSNIACYSVALDNKGYIYVCSPEEHEVRRYKPGDERGTVRSRWQWTRFSSQSTQSSNLYLCWTKSSCIRL